MDAIEYWQTVGQQEMQELCTDPDYLEWSERIEDERTGEIEQTYRLGFIAGTVPCSPN